jgi:transcriptional regulator with XRE-family HTH domain
VEDLARLVGERLRAARHERGLSLAALAETAGIGKGSLSEIENGASTVPSSSRLTSSRRASMPGEEIRAPATRP